MACWFWFRFFLKVGERLFPKVLKADESGLRVQMLYVFWDGSTYLYRQVVRTLSHEASQLVHSLQCLIRVSYAKQQSVQVERRCGLAYPSDSAFI